MDACKAIQKTFIFISCQIRLQIISWRTGVLGQDEISIVVQKKYCIHFAGDMCSWTDRFTELESESDSELEAESSNVKLSELKEKKKTTHFLFFYY